MRQIKSTEDYQVVLTEDGEVPNELISVRSLEKICKLDTTGELCADQGRRVCLLELIEGVAELQRSRRSSQLQRSKLLLKLLCLGKDELSAGGEGRHTDHWQKLGKW